MSPPYLLFDLDGTLTDPAPGITASIEHAATLLGVTVRGDARRFIGPSLRETFAEILQSREAARVEEAVRLYRERFASVGIYENRVYPGMLEVLARAEREGFALRVVTSKPKVYADRIVDHFGLRAHLPQVYGAELTGELSDKAELLALVLKQEQLPAHRACMIGDRQHDILGARAHGIHAIGVAWGYGSVDELVAARADRVVESLATLLPAARELLDAATPGATRG